MSSSDIVCIEDALQQNGYEGPSVAPGSYTAVISLGDATDTVRFTIEKDPRSFATDAQVNEWASTLKQVKATVNDVLTTLDNARKARADIKELIAANAESEIQELGKAAVAGIDAWEPLINQLKHETYEDEDNLPPRLVKHVRHLLDVIDDAGPPVAAGALSRLEDLKAEWATLETELAEIQSSDVAAINAWAKETAIPHISTRD